MVGLIAGILNGVTARRALEVNKPEQNELVYWEMNRNIQEKANGPLDDGARALASCCARVRVVAAMMRELWGGESGLDESIQFREKKSNRTTRQSVLATDQKRSVSSSGVSYPRATVVVRDVFTSLRPPPLLEPLFDLLVQRNHRKHRSLSSRRVDTYPLRPSLLYVSRVHHYRRWPAPPHLSNL